jgi:hypothetical protein
VRIGGLQRYSEARVKLAQELAVKAGKEIAAPNDDDPKFTAMSDAEVRTRAAAHPSQHADAQSTARRTREEGPRRPAALLFPHPPGHDGLVRVASFRVL